MRKRLSILSFALISLVIATPTPASAHAGIVSTFPTQGQVLDVMPDYVQVSFSEDLLTLKDQEVNTLSLTHFDGPEIELTKLLVKGNVISAEIPDGDYEAGTYELFYSIVSADGHKVSDSLSFSINGPVTTSASASATDSAPSKSNGVLPFPIVGAIVLVTLLGGFFALRARNRQS